MDLKGIPGEGHIGKRKLNDFKRLIKKSRPSLHGHNICPKTLITITRPNHRPTLIAFSLYALSVFVLKAPFTPTSQ